MCFVGYSQRLRGLYYAATLNAHIGFESWLERDVAMALDFELDVVCFASQPFWLFWADVDRVRSHAPDFFARTALATQGRWAARARTGGASRARR